MVYIVIKFYYVLVAVIASALILRGIKGGYVSFKIAMLSKILVMVVMLTLYKVRLWSSALKEVTI